MNRPCAIMDGLLVLSLVGVWGSLPNFLDRGGGGSASGGIVSQRGFGGSSPNLPLFRGGVRQSPKYVYGNAPGGRVIRAGILTASTLGARGEREDTSGQAIREVIANVGAAVEAYRVVPDDRSTIEQALRDWADDLLLDLILTTGGTGLSPSDVTPDATLAVVDRLVPGMAEAMRLEGLKHTPRAMLSRAVVGVRGQTLIVNLPGSPKGVRESLGAIIEVLPHALEILQRRPTDH